MIIEILAPVRTGLDIPPPAAMLAAAPAEMPAWPHVDSVCLELPDEGNDGHNKLPTKSGAVRGGQNTSTILRHGLFEKGASQMTS